MQFSNIVIDLLIIGMFIIGVYAFLILPRQREFRRRQKLVQSMEVGTTVLTYGGQIGVIKKIDRESGVVTLEVAEGIEARYVAAAITGEFDEKVYAESAQKELSEKKA